MLLKPYPLLFTGTVLESDADRNYIDLILKSLILSLICFVPCIALLSLVVFLSESILFVNIVITVLELLGFSKTIAYISIMCLTGSWASIQICGFINTLFEFLLSQIIGKHLLRDSANKR